MNYIGIENEYTVFSEQGGKLANEPDLLSGASRRMLINENLVMSRFLVESSPEFHPIRLFGRADLVWLANGGKWYYDSGHQLEYASPECKSVKELVLVDGAGDLILRKLAAAKEREYGQASYAMKRSALAFMDSKKMGTWGSHENYAVVDYVFSLLIDRYRECLVGEFFRRYLVSRQVFAGSGHLSYMLGQPRDGRLIFHVSPRAFYIRQKLERGTTGVQRPIVDIKDDDVLMGGNLNELRRLHIIIGDMNRSQWSVYLKFGVTVLVLAFLSYANEKDVELLTDKLPQRFGGLNALHEGSMAFNSPEEWQTFLGLIDVQRHIRDAVWDLRERVEERVPEFGRIFPLWSSALDAAARGGNDPVFSRRLDWMIKKKWIEEHLGASLADLPRNDDERLAKKLLSLDFSYQRVDKSDFYEALVGAGRAEEMFKAAETAHYLRNAPAGRSGSRVEIARSVANSETLKKYIDGFDWGSIRFHRGGARPDPSGKIFTAAAAPMEVKTMDLDDRKPADLQSELEAIEEWIKEVEE